MIGWQGWRSRRGRQSAGRQWAALANSAMQGRRAPDPDLRDEALAPQAYAGFALLALGLLVLDGRILARAAKRV